MMSMNYAKAMPVPGVHLDTPYLLESHQSPDEAFDPSSGRGVGII